MPEPGVTRRAKAVLPERVVDWLRASIRGRTLGPTAVDLSRLELIRQAPLESLSDSSYLEGELLPMLGLNDESPELYPRELHPFCGQGLRAWQYPCQFGRYLTFLAKYRVNSYLEIGVRHGGTFLITCEFLARLNRLDRSVAVDLFRAPAIAAYARTVPFRVVSLEADSRGRRFRQVLDRQGPFDLVLIDGDHSYAGCWADFETVRDAASILVFHDIVSHVARDVPRVWRRVRNDWSAHYEFHEFVDQYPEVVDRRGGSSLGIGVAVNRTLAQRSV